MNEQNEALNRARVAQTAGSLRSCRTPVQAQVSQAHEYPKQRAGGLVVTEHGDLVMLTIGQPHYLTGEYTGVVIRMNMAKTGHQINLAVPDVDGAAIVWTGKIVRPVGHIDEYLSGTEKIDLTPAEKPDWMLDPMQRIARLERKLAEAGNKFTLPLKFLSPAAASKAGAFRFKVWCGESIICGSIAECGAPPDIHQSSGVTDAG